MSHHALSKELVLRLCGGTMPETDACNWMLVDHFKVVGDRIVPYSNGVVVGPDLKVVIAPNQDNTETALLKAITDGEEETDRITRDSHR